MIFRGNERDHKINLRAKIHNTPVLITLISLLILGLVDVHLYLAGKADKGSDDRVVLCIPLRLT